MCACMCVHRVCHVWMSLFVYECVCEYVCACGCVYECVCACDSAGEGQVQLKDSLICMDLRPRFHEQPGPQSIYGPSSRMYLLGGEKRRKSPQIGSRSSARPRPESWADRSLWASASTPLRGEGGACSRGVRCLVPREDALQTLALRSSHVAWMLSHHDTRPEAAGALARLWPQPGPWH